MAYKFNKTQRWTSFRSRLYQNSSNIYRFKHPRTKKRTTIQTDKQDFPEIFFSGSNRRFNVMVSPLQFLLLLWISSTILDFSSSYADAAGSNVSAAKVRQISWKPRSVFFNSLLVFLLVYYVLNLIALQSFRVRRFSFRRRMRSFDISCELNRKFHEFNP